MKQLSRRDLLSQGDDELDKGASVPPSSFLQWQSQFHPARIAALVSDNSDDPRVMRQLKREIDAWDSGYTNFIARAARAINEDDDPLRVRAVRALARKLVDPLAAYIEKIVSEKATPLAGRASSAKARGRPPVWLRAYRALGSEKMAYSVLAGIVSAGLEHDGPARMHRRKAGRASDINAETVATTIGRTISSAARQAALKEAAPGLLKAIEDYHNKAGSTSRHREIAMALLLNKVELEDPSDQEAVASWTYQDLQRTGMWLLLAAEKACPSLVKVEGSKRRSNRSQKSPTFATDLSVTVSPAALRWINEAIQRQALAATVRKPMLCPPIPWPPEGPPRGGGYLIDHAPWLVNRFARKSGAAQLSAWKEAPPVEAIAAINAIQRVEWAVNTGVLDVAMAAVERGIKLPGLPGWLVVDEPPKPRGIETNEEARRAWRKQAGAVKRRNFKQREKAFIAKLTLDEANELRSEPCFWYPAFADFRGRIYPSPTMGLSPHGSDLGKALLMFANGKPIGTSWRHLAAQVAKAFGHDKIGWDERVQWTEDNSEMILRIATDPLGNRQEWLREAGEDIWTALAAAIEWKRWLDEGRSEDFITHLPCQIDGTCNGMQHYAALARDTRLAKLVNLCRGEEQAPRDLYMAVAQRLLEVVRASRNASMHSDDWRCSELWRRLSLDNPKALRPLAKVAVMTKSYGGSYGNVRDAVDEFHDEITEGKPDEWRDVGDPETKEGAKARREVREWLAKKLNAVLKEFTGSADAIANWLKKADGLLAENNVPLIYRTPSGWPWANTELKTDRDRPKFTGPDGKQHQITVRKELQGQHDKSEQAKGIAPNFIHGLDAAALVLAVNEMVAGGVEALTTIHDCVGCLAPDMPVVARAFRSGFVRVHEAMPLDSYRETVVAHLSDRVKLNEIPARKSFDVSEVLEAPYFAS